MSEKSCCCCFSVKTGAFIIGVLSLFDLLNELDEFNFARCIVKLIVVAIFGYMVWNDSAAARKYFFIAFCANPLLQMLATFLFKTEE